MDVRRLRQLSTGLYTGTLCSIIPFFLMTNASVVPPPLVRPYRFAGSRPDLKTFWGSGAAVARIRSALGGMLGGVWVSGEVSNLSMPASGHVYLTLKDRDASIRCAYFAGSARRHPATFRTGDRIEVTGAVDVYAKSGDLQIKVTDWRHAGAGALYEAYLRLKARLSAEGLFFEGLKKPLPFFVRRVVVVTSAQAAALQDVRRTIDRRTPWVRLMLSPAYVQGESAPLSLMAALDRADAAGADVILLVRGGGSFEDLSAFNDERLVRKLRSLKTPVIAGVGHESDETLAALAADVCASTPTAAAEHIGPDIHYWRSLLDDFEERMTLAVDRKTDDAGQTLDRLEARMSRQDGFLSRQEGGSCAQRMLLERLAAGSLQGAKRASRPQVRGSQASAPCPGGAAYSSKRWRSVWRMHRRECSAHGRAGSITSLCACSRRTPCCGPEASG